MIDKKKKNNFKYLLIYILTILCLFSSLTGLVVNFSNADNIEYSNVLEDLQKDETFNIEDYPVVENDYSLKLITIAESQNNELFVYVYQPSKTHNATSINISLESDNQLKYINYKLELLNQNGVFFKYKVIDLLVKETPYRYYEISNIYRNFDNLIDDELDNGNTISEVGFNVGKSFIIVGSGNDITVHVQDIETIEITTKYVGFLRFSGGMQPPWDIVGNLDAHFVAFSTDKNIDNLMEAEVYYCLQEYIYSTDPIFGVIDQFYYDIKEDYSYLKSDDFVDWTGDGWFAEKYSFDKIQTVSAFFKDESLRDYTYSAGLFNICTQSKLTDEAFQDIKQMSWVLRFTETSYIEKTLGTVTLHNGTIVSDVSILRLKFLSEGKIYNLGVIDNKQSGDGFADNITNSWLSFSWWTWLIIGLIVLCLLGWLFPSVFVVLWKIIKGFALGLYYVFIKCPSSLFFDD